MIGTMTQDTKDRIRELAGQKIIWQINWTICPISNHLIRRMMPGSWKLSRK